MECPYCGKELQPMDAGIGLVVMVCPDAATKHPRMIYVPQIEYDKALSPRPWLDNFR